MENSLEVRKSENILPEGLSILIIDKMSEAGNLEQEIEILGHMPLVVFSYEDAFRAIAKNSFDLIIVSMDLPGNWLDTIAGIREQLGDIHIITMTENNSREIEQQAREQKVIYYVVKPIDMREMESVIDHISKKKTGQI